MKKQYKRISNRKRKQVRQIFIRFVLIQICIVILFLFTFYKTSKADSQNTYTINIQIVDVIVSDGSNQLPTVYLETPIGYYRTDWKTYDEKIYNPINSRELKKSLTEEQLITLTVLDNSDRKSVV